MGNHFWVMLEVILDLKVLRSTVIFGGKYRFFVIFPFFRGCSWFVGGNVMPRFAKFHYECRGVLVVCLAGTRDTQVRTPQRAEVLKPLLLCLGHVETWFGDRPDTN